MKKIILLISVTVLLASCSAEKMYQMSLNRELPIVNKEEIIAYEAPYYEGKIFIKDKTKEQIQSFLTIFIKRYNSNSSNILYQGDQEFHKVTLNDTETNNIIVHGIYTGNLPLHDNRLINKSTLDYTIRLKIEDGVIKYSYTFNNIQDKRRPDYVDRLGLDFLKEHMDLIHMDFIAALIKSDFNKEKPSRSFFYKYRAERMEYNKNCLINSRHRNHNH